MSMSKQVLKYRNYVFVFIFSVIFIFFGSRITMNYLSENHVFNSTLIYSYDEFDDGYSITGFRPMFSKLWGDRKIALAIPTEKSGRPIRRIEDDSFTKHSTGGKLNVESIAVPINVTTIGSNVLGDSDSLKYVEIPETLMDLGVDSFAFDDDLSSYDGMWEYVDGSWTRTGLAKSIFGCSF